MYIVPIPKVTPPLSAGKLRPVSLTPTLARVAESSVIKWVMQDMTSQQEFPWQPKGEVYVTLPGPTCSLPAPNAIDYRLHQKYMYF